MRMRRLELTSGILCGLLGLAALAVLFVLLPTTTLIPGTTSNQSIDIPGIRLLYAYTSILALISAGVTLGTLLHVFKNTPIGSIIIWLATGLLAIGIVLGPGGTPFLFFPGLLTALMCSIIARHREHERDLLQRAGATH